MEGGVDMVEGGVTLEGVPVDGNDDGRPILKHFKICLKYNSRDDK